MLYIYFLENYKEKTMRLKIKKISLTNNFYYFFVKISKVDLKPLLAYYYYYQVLDLNTKPAPLTYT